LKLVGLRLAFFILGDGLHASPFKKRVSEVFDLHRFAAVHVHDLTAADIENMVSFLPPILALLLAAQMLEVRIVEPDFVAGQELIVLKNPPMFRTPLFEQRSHAVVGKFVGDDFVTHEGVQFRELFRVRHVDYSLDHDQRRKFSASDATCCLPEIFNGFGRIVPRHIAALVVLHPVFGIAGFRPAAIRMRIVRLHCSGVLHDLQPKFDLLLRDSSRLQFLFRGVKQVSNPCRAAVRPARRLLAPVRVVKRE